MGKVKWVFGGWGWQRILNTIQVLNTLRLIRVWKNYGMTDEQAKKAGMNPKMFNSFTTGDKSSIEMAAVANALRITMSKERSHVSCCWRLLILQINLIPKSAGGGFRF
jgi:predicted homoserine dehydrogenase-like protein